MTTRSIMVWVLLLLNFSYHCPSWQTKYVMFIYKSVCNYTALGDFAVLAPSVRIMDGTCCHGALLYQVYMPYQSNLPWGFGLVAGCPCCVWHLLPVCWSTFGKVFVNELVCKFHRVESRYTYMRITHIVIIY